MSAGRTRGGAALLAAGGCLAIGIILGIQAGTAAETGPVPQGHSVIAQTSAWQRTLLLQDYNTRVVVIGTALLGAASGAVGSFTLLRKRALMGDALSHATLPGIGLAFLASVAWGGDGKSLPWLLLGASVTGVLGLLAILFIRNSTRLKEDAALGIVLSVFFGMGIAILGIVQQMKSGHAAGLESFIYGKAASLSADDALLIGLTGGVSCLACWLLFKEFKLLCFDEGFAASQGYPVVRLDLLLMSLVVMVTIVGLQAVGLVLVIALQVIPAAAARFWSDRMSRVAVISAMIGGISSLVGAGFSAVFPRLPSGAMIVLVATALFTVSLLGGRTRGVIPMWWRRRQLEVDIHRQHLLRAAFEWLEAHQAAPPVRGETRSEPIPVADLIPMRSWSSRSLKRNLRRAERAGLVTWDSPHEFRLTPAGVRAAARHVHDHRLWELYLIEYADTAPANVDRGADSIEHVLDAEIVDELESLLTAQDRQPQVFPSPHPLAGEHEAGEAASPSAR